jgi:hypothetical protein
MAVFLFILILTGFNVSVGQKNEVELMTKQQEAFCALWKKSRIEQQYALSDLCYRRVRKFGNQVSLACTSFSSLLQMCMKIDIATFAADLVLFSVDS